MAGLSSFLVACREALKLDQIDTEQGTLQRLQTATFPSHEKVAAVVYPERSEDVATVLRAANAHQVPVYPISGGKNWGLGSTVPVQPENVVMDLARMNHILKVDEEMMYVTLQPGVTFQQLFEYLEDNAPALMMDGIGSTPYASIIGNTVERGHGLGLLADRFDHVAGMTVVLPTGETIQTGFERYDGSALGPLAKWGVGPYVDGLFTQSNYGVVTQLTMFLKPKPAYFQSIVFNVADNDSLPAVIDKLRKVRMQGLQVSLRIFNDVRMIALASGFPWDKTQATPLSAEKKAEIKKEKNVEGTWIGVGALYSLSKAHALAEREYFIEELNPLVSSVTVYDEDTVKQAQQVADEGTKARMDLFFNKSVLRGLTSDTPVNMTYWRKPGGVPDEKDIHRDRCGVLWYCPAVPNRGVDVLKAVEIVEQSSKKYGFEPNMGFLFISQRTLDITGALCYDRDIEGEDERAMACHDEMMRQFIEHGYSPYRLGIQSMDLMGYTEDASKELFRSLKRTLDPNGVLSPGRYEV
ncbi:MAG TPA: FAD-linked oxidase [Cytophagales bacterium]|nr:FAD-linked oxidase [Cytophagales bacterium]HAA19810.1 FAD-linked oxidase [Cytophagales bacterium]HAP64238.1 FAD-linked oxidase [Cytophagales bacterium]